MFKWIKKLFKSKPYHLGTSTPPQRPFPNSGSALQFMQESQNLSPAARLAIIQELIGGQDVCNECGQTKKRPALITEEQAMELLGVKK